MSEESRPYPTKGDQLFKGDWDIDLNADISRWNSDLHGYAKGYRIAADLIIEKVVAEPQRLSSEVSYLVFPVVLLYRHYLELRLKETIVLGSRLYSKTPQGIPSHHRIAELWSQARPHLEQINSRDHLDAIESCIKELDSIDPDGSAFRYPVNRKGESTIAPDWVINLRHLGETMAKIGNLLDGSAIAFYVLYDQMNEFKDEY